MEKTTFTIGRRHCTLLSAPQPRFLLLQAVDDHDLEVLDSEAAAIGELAGAAFSLVAVHVGSWADDLTPWPAPPVFGHQPFGSGAADTLGVLVDKLLPHLEQGQVYDPSRQPLIVGGYSLAGLFALWCGYQDRRFQGVAAASPSVWYPGWEAYASGHIMRSQAVYLSLGDKEEHTRNAVMARVGDNIRLQHDLLHRQGVATTLEWNKGGHFLHPDLRTAKAFAWAMGQVGR